MIEEPIAWHPAFRQALELDFEHYRDLLDFNAEVPLTAEPMRIDMLITKKDPNALIDNPIAAIFKGHNLFEFKSPTDYLSVTDFYKGLAYGFSYKSLYGADIHDITFSFVVPYYPREVMKEIRGIRGYRIGKGGRGITLISCALGMEMQLIEAKKLSAESNVFLRHLRNDLSAGD